MVYADNTQIILDGVGSDLDLMRGPNGYVRAGFVSNIPNLLTQINALPNPPVQLDDFTQAVNTRTTSNQFAMISCRTLLGTAASFNLPVEPIFIILGIDELMDMARTSVNVIGNCLATVVIARWEGEFGN